MSWMPDRQFGFLSGDHFFQPILSGVMNAFKQVPDPEEEGFIDKGMDIFHCFQALDLHDAGPHLVWTIRHLDGPSFIMKEERDFIDRMGNLSNDAHRSKFKFRVN